MELNANNLFTTSADVITEQERDSVSSFAAWESGFYEATLKTAYIDYFQGGSIFINCLYEIRDEQGNKLTLNEKETVWSAKTQGNYYIDKKNGTKKRLIGANKMDSLCRLITGKTLEEVQKEGGLEDKVHKVYDFTDRKEVATELATIMPFTNVPVYLGLRKVIENKQALAANGLYVNTNETREKNTVDKIFNSNKKTLLEEQKGEEALYFETWISAYAGKTLDKSVPGSTTQTGMPQSKPSVDLGL